MTHRLAASFLAAVAGPEQFDITGPVMGTAETPPLAKKEESRLRIEMKTAE